MDTTVTNILVPALMSFIIGVGLTPLVTHFLYKHKVWKKSGGKIAMNGQVAKVFNKLKGKDEHKTRHIPLSFDNKGFSRAQCVSMTSLLFVQMST